LERLHKIDVAATALDQMVQDYARQKQQLEAEDAAQREIEEYEYKKALERKKAQDKYEEDVRLAEKKNKERQETLEKGWQQREAALKERETSWRVCAKRPKSSRHGFQKEAKGAAGAIAARDRSQIRAATAGAQKDAETEKRLAELKVGTLEDAVARQQTQIAAIEKQLAEAKQQVQDIAVKAIEGASGARRYRTSTRSPWSGQEPPQG